jgi:hypothetical protein
MTAACLDSAHVLVAAVGALRAVPEQAHHHDDQECAARKEPALQRTSPLSPCQADMQQVAEMNSAGTFQRASGMKLQPAARTHWSLPVAYAPNSPVRIMATSEPTILRPGNKTGSAKLLSSHSAKPAGGQNDATVQRWDGVNRLWRCVWCRCRDTTAAQRTRWWCPGPGRSRGSSPAAAAAW